MSRRFRLLSPPVLNLSFGRFVFLGSKGEPKYDGYQIWFHEDIPDYNNPLKNIINQKFVIKNYPI